MKYASKQFLDSMPINAKIDLMEWNDYNVTDLEYAKIILSGKTDIKNLLRENKNIIITDDKPFNEYYLLRRNKIISHN
jgi:hypothetical protein